MLGGCYCYIKIVYEFVLVLGALGYQPGRGFEEKTIRYGSEGCKVIWMLKPFFKRPWPLVC